MYKPLISPHRSNICLMHFVFRVVSTRRRFILIVSTFIYSVIRNFCNHDINHLYLSEAAVVSFSSLFATVFGYIAVSVTSFPTPLFQLPCSANTSNVLQRAVWVGAVLLAAYSQSLPSTIFFHSFNVTDWKAVPWLTRSVAGLSPQWPGFEPWSVRVRFVLDEVAALGQVFLRVLRFSSVNIITLCFSILIYYLQV
jgi:hypothetical protein